MESIIKVNKLKTYFYTNAGVIKALNGVDFNISGEKTLGIVGESGCGKSVTALSIMRLIKQPGRIVNGQILFRHKRQVTDLAKLDADGIEMRSIRGNKISMIFQEPMTSLNPVFTIGNQIMESIILHQGIGRKDAKDKAIEMLNAVGISSPKQRLTEYPFQLSGGMRQRIMIAIALSCNPSLLIADEPTTALDVTIQAQVLTLMKKLQAEFKAAILFITHNLGVISKMADDVAVMYLGNIVESASVYDIFREPKHPYTKGLMNSIPSLIASKQNRLTPIEGTVPDLLEIGKGCGFATRCRKVSNFCRTNLPPLVESSPHHYVACWNI